MKEIKKVLIIDDDAIEAANLCEFLTANDCKTYTTSTVLKDVANAVKVFLPHDIIISLSNAQEDVAGLAIAQYISINYVIPVLLLIELHEQEDLHEYIETKPYSSYIKTNIKENDYRQILNTLDFSSPFIVGDLHKYKSRTLKVVKLKIDQHGAPIFPKEHYLIFKEQEIRICDILYLETTNSYHRNCVLIKLQSDKEHYYVIRGTLIKCMQWLNNQLFTHINASFIVNNEKVTSWNLYKNVIVDDMIISIGRSVYKERAEKAYNRYHPTIAEMI